jgi:ribosomal protein L11 methyltransferase
MWFELIIRNLQQDKVEPLSDQLEECGALSVTYTDKVDNPIFEPELNTTPLWQQTVITALFNDESLMNVARAVIESDASDSEIESRQFEDKVWEREWLKSFKPMCFGERLWVCPTHYEPPQPNAVNVMLDPGLAFGTGTHQTTALCLSYLDKTDVAEKVVCDYGTGSGILAIAALKLGAKRVYAVDIDPQAIIATKQNTLNNGLSLDCLIHGLVDDVTIPQVDLMLANILATPLIELAPVLSGLVKPNGELVLSGLLETQIEDVQQAYQPFFNTITVELKDEWAMLWLS